MYADIDVRETTGFVIMTECDVVMKMTSAAVMTNTCPGSTSIIGLAYTGTNETVCLLLKTLTYLCIRVTWMYIQ